jgi:hypothetical protein
METDRAPHAIVIAAVLAAVLGLNAPGQDAPSSAAQTPGAQDSDAQSRETKGIPARATPADYQAHAQAGKVTVAAEFKGHSIPTPEATFTSEDYVAIEVGLFGPPEARIKLSYEDFSLRINGTLKTAKKPPLPAQPYALVFKSLKDPSWEPPVPVESKSKTSIGGGGGQNDPPPATPHMPFELVRIMDQRVQKASLAEGERELPQAGLIFFSYHGKTDNLRSIELTYTGPTGKTTLDLH